MYREAQQSSNLCCNGRFNVYFKGSNIIAFQRKKFGALAWVLCFAGGYLIVQCNIGQSYVGANTRIKKNRDAAW